MEYTRINIKQISDDEEKETITRMILESLPDWFGIPEAREEYIAESKDKPFFCALDGETAVGFLYLKETGRHTVELAVMGVRKEYHRKGIGGALFDAAKKEAKKQGYSFIQVKTVQMGKYAEYDDTNRFYLSLWDSKSWRSFRLCGMNGIRVKFTSWPFEKPTEGITPILVV